MILEVCKMTGWEASRAADYVAKHEHIDMAKFSMINSNSTNGKPK